MFKSGRVYTGWFITNHTDGGYWAHVEEHGDEYREYWVKSLNDSDTPKELPTNRTQKKTMTIYTILWIEDRNYGNPNSSVFTNRHEAQAFALERLQDLNVTDEEIADAERGCNGPLWDCDHWWLYTSSRREEDIYVSFETQTINLPQE